MGLFVVGLLGIQVELGVDIDFRWALLRRWRFHPIFPKYRGKHGALCFCWSFACHVFALRTRHFSI